MSPTPVRRVGRRGPSWNRRSLSTLALPLLLLACDHDPVAVVAPGGYAAPDPALSLLAADPWLRELTGSLSDPGLRALLGPPDDAASVRELVSGRAAGRGAERALDPDDALILDVFALSLAAADDAVLSPPGGTP